MSIAALLQEFESMGVTELPGTERTGAVIESVEESMESEETAEGTAAEQLEVREQQLHAVGMKLIEALETAAHELKQVLQPTK